MQSFIENLYSYNMHHSSNAAISKMMVTRERRFLTHSIEILMRRFMSSGCSEIRDCVHGLLGLAQDAQAVNILELVIDPVKTYIYHSHFGNIYFA
jgi:hypothetical protein